MSTVLLISGTVGKTKATAEVGDVVTVELSDENGNTAAEDGVVAEILE